jgi:transposase
MRIDLTSTDRQALLEWKRHARHWRERQRAEALLLLNHLGSSHAVAEQLDMSERTVRRCCIRWSQGGVAALAEGTRGGRHPLLGPEQAKWLCEAATREVQTSGQLQAALHAQFPEAPHVCRDTIKKTLRRAGFRYKRTRYGLKKSVTPAPSPPRSSA